MSRPTNTPELIQERFWDRMTKCPLTKCWEWTGCTTNGGYGHIKFCGKLILTHRLSWLITNGDIPVNINVCHSCDNPKCCNPEHLFLGSQHDNVMDCSSKGRMRDCSGEANPNVKLSDDQVAQIRNSDKSNVELAKELGVHRSHVWAVRRGQKR